MAVLPAVGIEQLIPAGGAQAAGQHLRFRYAAPQQLQAVAGLQVAIERVAPALHQPCAREPFLQQLGHVRANLPLAEFYCIFAMTFLTA